MPRPPARPTTAFTLIERLVVIAKAAINRHRGWVRVCFADGYAASCDPNLLSLNPLTPFWSAR